MMRSNQALPALALVLAGLAASGAANAQAPAQAAAATRSPRESALADFTGWWTAVVSEDWRWRMVAPLKGDLSNIPANVKARAAAEAWDLARDEAAGVQCRAFGAPTLLREPGHLHISWADDATLKLEADAGNQQRLLRFTRAEAGPASLQGDSLAQWEPVLRTPYGVPAGGLGLAARGGNQSKSLQVVTTNLQPGYLRKNGLPYGANAKLTEYFDLFRDPDGTRWLLVLSIVEDPDYLNAPWVTTQHFKELKDGSAWHPTPCSLR